MDQSTLSMGSVEVNEFGDLQWGPIVTIEMMELKRVLGRRKPLYQPWNTLVYIYHVVDDENEAQRSERIKASKTAQSRLQVSLVLGLCFLTQRTFMEHSIWARVHQGCILSPCLFNLYAEYIMRNAGLEETQAGI